MSWVPYSWCERETLAGNTIKKQVVGLAREKSHKNLPLFFIYPPFRLSFDVEKGVVPIKN